jgi:tRNA G37 N-methylase Trm5
MAADYKQMERNFRQFYDFSGKTVVGVGAGGGPFTDLVCESRKLIVIDKDPAAIRFWEARIAAGGLKDRVEIVQADFGATSRRGDVVYFEFCLHEMDDSTETLRHALTLAPEVLVFDHLPDSEWAFQGAEEDKVRRSTDALASFHCLRQQAFRTEQRFENYQQLLDRVSPQGALAVQRAERYRDAVDITIPMTYGLSLLCGEPSWVAAAL